MKKKLLVLADGSSIHTVKWIEGLSQSDEFEIHLASLNAVDPSRYAYPNMIGTHEFRSGAVSEKGNNFQYVWQLPKLKKLIAEIQPDYISTLYLTSYGFFGALLKGQAKLVHFVVGNDIMVAPERHALNKWITQFSLKRADAIVSASKTMTEKLTQRLGVNPKKTPILTQQYGVTDAVIDHPRGQNKYDFVSNRAWIVNSNIDYFLKLVEGLSAKTLVIGRILPGSEHLGEGILSHAQKLGCEIKPHLPYEENINLVAQSRFLISLTSSDGASLSVLEAMAMGTVPILSDIAPNREWVRPGENGFLIPLNDVQQGRKILHQAFALSEGEYRAMAEKCRAVVKDRASLRKNMRKTADLMLHLSN